MAIILKFCAESDLFHRIAISIHHILPRVDSSRPVQRLNCSLVITMLILLATGCTSSSPVVLESANQNSRVRVVVIHHTSIDFQESLDVLSLPSERPVSSHYLVPEPDDPSYTKKLLKLHSLVAEEQRAWHAGVSYWAGRSALNDMSIGIELVNQTHCYTEETIEDEESPDPDNPDEICFYPDFAISQIDMLLDLLGEILERHPDVQPINIIGHSDVAPQRKIDPGPRFPWQRLYRQGFGAWYDDETVIRYWQQFKTQMPTTLQLQDALHTYGYEIELSGAPDLQNHNVVRAFQMHFVPWHVSGKFTAESAAALFALIEKYRSNDLERLLQLNDN
jgi:N-acetylmuramoyl-L-alanine amidase